jgi:hypothetical protein
MHTVVDVIIIIIIIVVVVVVVIIIIIIITIMDYITCGVLGLMTCFRSH